MLYQSSGVYVLAAIAVVAAVIALIVYCATRLGAQEDERQSRMENEKG